MFSFFLFTRGKNTESEMNISVKDSNGVPSLFEVSRKDSIAQIQAMIERETGIPINEQELTVVQLKPIFVETSDGKRIKLNVNPSNSIEDVQTMIATKLSIPKDEQNVVCAREKTMQIFMKNLKGKTVTYEVKPSDSIEGLRKKIKDRDGIPTCKQRLTYESKQLEDGYTFSFYKIKRESTLDLTIRIGGGDCPKCSEKHGH